MESLSWDYILKYVLLGDSATGKSSLLIRLTDDRFDLTEPTLGVEFGSRILSVGEDGKRVKVQCWDTAGTESFRSITRSYFRGAAGALLVYDVTRRESFDHVTSWLEDLRKHADENVSIILVANKIDLCSSSPTELPSISYGQPVPSPSPLNPIPANSSVSSSPSSSPSPPCSPNLTQKKQTKSSSKSVPGTSMSTGETLRVRAVSSLEGALYAKEHGLLYVETSAKEGWGVVDAFEWTAREVLEKVKKGEMERRKPGGVKLNESAPNKAGKCC
ncbi:rab family protein [Kwoniella heveanensis CBS 569]|uniref:Rab family protein n=1 Tax=Kwoniella heveanensis BCC8398 TaxID=1296120 RepID=A0A1B9H2F9_9TREE|nr:rab family protein [Kwoniella heveanensis BCC8398]OCF38483.1 rab family protein [Kwoniella heveanensis CBS 569]